MSAGKTVQVASAKDLIEEAKSKIVRCRYFKSGKTDKYGKIEGWHEFPAGAVPFEHQVHHYDDRGRVVYFEKFVREFSKPSLRVFLYEDGWSVAEGVWIDRYGRIENYHRYHYDTSTNLLTWRAEYDHEGKLYYYIKSAYDASSSHIEDVWFTADDLLHKRLEYTNDPATGEPLEQREFNARNELVGALRFKYDKAFNVIERAWHNPAGTRMSRFVYAYDAKNQVTKVELRGETDKIEARQEFAYDHVGNVITEKWFDQAGKLYKDLRFEGLPEPKKSLADPKKSLAKKK
ncbi:MAG: hypothetical protein FJZ01_12325 [Candidatus Sericytochromatia bacterium]|nr:hypothetical protein [Candidatus Tanganyikabacteria bacterium]